MRDFFLRMAERALDRARIARPLIGPMFPLEPIVETTGLERAGEPAARTELPVQHPHGGRRPIVPREILPGALTPEVVDAANAPSSVESSEVPESVESAPLLAGEGAPDSDGIWKETRMQPHREEDESPVLEPVPTMEAGGASPASDG